MRIFFILTAVVFCISTDRPLHATSIYRYAWVPGDPGQSDSAQPAQFGTPGSGFIDLLAPANTGTSAGLSAIYDLQFTGFAAEGEGPLPEIPPLTYNLSSALPASVGGLMWNNEKITFMEGITLVNPSGAGMSSRISDFEVQTVFPLPYQFNEASRDGEWLFQGELSRNRVPESGRDSMILALSGLAVVAFHLATRRRNSLPKLR